MRVALDAVTIEDKDTGSLPVGIGAQPSMTAVLQNAATADGNGTAAVTDGYNGCQMIEVQKTGAGSCTLTVEGSFDGASWYAVGYYPVDGQATLTRAVSGIALGAGSVTHVFQVLDLYPQIRARISGTSGAVSVTAKLYAVAV
jgi:hypothetical protein